MKKVIAISFGLGVVCQTIILSLPLLIPLVGGLAALLIGYLFTQIGIWCWIGSIAWGKDTDPNIQFAWGLSFVALGLIASASGNNDAPMIDIVGISFGISIPVCIISGAVFRINHKVKKDSVLLIPPRDY